MKGLLLRCLVVLSGAFLVLGTAGVGPAQAAGNVGGIDLTQYCQGYGYKSATTIGSTAYDWRCVADDGTYHGIDMPLACSISYGFDSKDRVGNFYDVNSWRCWRPANLVGGLDLNAYCRSIGYASATAIGSTAYDWRCISSSGALGGIDTTRACRAQHGQIAIDRFVNFYDRNSWECRA
jgi:hypothetical protein